jgi:hypothetical protein
MVYTLVLEASAERIESSSLSRRTIIWGYSSSGRAVALQAIGGRFESCYLHQFLENTMKTRKPRNHIALALSKRGGAGSHQKSHKQLRGQWKRNLDV